MISAGYRIDDEGLRLLANLEQHYAAWVEAERILLPGRLSWKTVSGRDVLKTPKDAKQGALLLDAVRERMPHYPLDDAFREELPAELVPHFDRWREQSAGH
jgi:hypothetical protein